MNAHDDGVDNSMEPLRRRRSFLAVRRETSLDADTVPLATDEDDIPVLTEVVLVEERNYEAPAGEEPDPRPDPASYPLETFDARLEELAAQMADAIGRQLAYELPTLIEATLLNASEDLRSGITATMEAALRDFIAHRKQLPLPLDEPDAE